MVTIAQFNQEQYAATEDVRCVQIYVPDDDSYMPLLAGLLALAGIPENYLDPESVQAEGVAATWKDAYTQSDWGGCVMPVQTAQQGRVTVWHRLGIVLAGAANTHVLDANQLYGHYVRQNPATVLDSTYQDIWLTAGEYAFDVLYVRVSTAGKLRLTLEYQPDGSDTIVVSSGDMSGATAYNQHLNGNFTLTDTGHYRIYTNVQAAGGSGGFFLPMTCVDIWKTAD